jgi:hypothetical protein
VASEEEVRLGRLAVQRGFATQEQVIEALRVRNTSGGDLGELLVKKGFLPAAELVRLREAARAAPSGTGKTWNEASTDHAISITGTREILARDQLSEALRVKHKDPRGALRELRRLEGDFPDTESGVRAGEEARAILDAHPELGS